MCVFQIGRTERNRRYENIATVKKVKGEEMKSYYADYVAHGTRFYLKNRQLKRFTNTIDEINWKVSRLTYKELNDYERKVVYDFYVEKNAENWEIILKFEKEWARKRGLI